MRMYAKALGLLYPGAKLHCLLVSTRLRKIIECP
jgi:hypothetical protein